MLQKLSRCLFATSALTCQFAQVGEAQDEPDPIGSNLYYLAPTDNNGTLGVTIFPGDGSLPPLGTIVHF